MLGLSRLSTSPAEVRFRRQAPRAVATRPSLQAGRAFDLQQTSAAVTQALSGLRRADVAAGTFEHGSSISTLAGMSTPGGEASMCLRCDVPVPPLPPPLPGRLEPAGTVFSPLPPPPARINDLSPAQGQQPLSPLVAGVALCLNVVREPEGTSAQDGALWPVGANPAQRLLLRARVSAGGSRMPPNHADLVESSFPPPWRRTGRRWLHYARFVCALDEMSFWQAARLLALEAADVTDATPIVMRASAWSEAFADDLLRRFGTMFCAETNGDEESGEADGSDEGPVGGYPSNFGGRFAGQAFLFGARGADALYGFGEASTVAERAHLDTPPCSPPDSPPLPSV